MSSTISSTTSGVNSLFLPQPAESTAPASASAPTQRYTPLWLVNTAGGTASFEALGIRAPSANGDLSVLLAEASLALERSADENQRNKGLAALAGLAGALAGFGLEALGTDKEKKSKTVAESKPTLKALNDSTGPLLDTQADLNNQITQDRSDISSLQTALASQSLTPAQRTALQEQLAAKQGHLDGLLTTREGVDIQLAQARIDNLDQQVTDLQAQLARATPGSDEAKAIQNQIDARSGEAGQARTDLNTFRNGAKTESARDNFSTTTRSAVLGTVSELTGRVAGYESALSIVADRLEKAAGAAVAVAALAATNFNLTQASNDDEAARRHDGIESAFEAIAEALDDASKATVERFKADDSTRTADEADAARRVQTLAAAFLTAVADIVATLNNQADSPQAPMPVPRETVANRVRVGV